MVGRPPSAVTAAPSDPLLSLRAKFPSSPVLWDRYQGTSRPRSTFIFATSAAVSVEELAVRTLEAPMVAVLPATVTANGPADTVCPDTPGTVVVCVVVTCGKKFESQHPP